jgi:hypothetical protein
MMHCARTFTHHGTVWYVEPAGHHDSPGAHFWVCFWPKGSPDERVLGRIAPIGLDQVSNDDLAEALTQAILESVWRAGEASRATAAD